MITAVTAVAEWRFFDRFYYGAIYKSAQAMISYTVLTVCTVLQAIAFLATLWCMILVIYRVIRSHTGYVQGKTVVGDGEAKMIDTLQKEEKNSFVYAFIAAALYAVSDVCYVFLAPTVGFMGLIHCIVAIACIGFFGKAMSALGTAIHTKYMLE